MRAEEKTTTAREKKKSSRNNCQHLAALISTHKQKRTVDIIVLLWFTFEEVCAASLMTHSPSAWEDSDYSEH